MKRKRYRMRSPLKDEKERERKKWNWVKEVPISKGKQIESNERYLKKKSKNKKYKKSPLILRHWMEE